MDRGIIELLGPNGISLNLYNKSYTLHKTETGFIFHYIFIILLGIVIILSFFIFWKFFLIYFDLRVIGLVILTFTFLLLN